ncbi:MAG TPA: hypothetical protein DIW81_05460 [Planctomycetaceae bacterium]|nr:hypothetical protein [Planctomycetaceae bacterium]
MKRYLAVATITIYLGALSWGIFSDTFAVGNVAHPAMYYVVWDMFCGWSGYECRQHLIAQGESGQYYKLNPAPWGEFRAFGPADRIDYDSFAAHSQNIARNILRNTEHEPIQRVYLVEENWSKRYNIPDYLWSMKFEEEKESYSYYHTRMIYNSECEPIESRMGWASAIHSKQLETDPRLAKMRNKAKPFYAVTPYSQTPVQSTNSIPAYATDGILPASYQQTQ